MSGGWTGRGLPLALWVGAVTSGSALLSLAVGAVLLAGAGRLDQLSAEALALGALLGLALSAVAVCAAHRLAVALQELRSAAVRRLQDPSAPVEGRPLRQVAARASRELAQLSAVLEALHLRVRLSDALGEHARREAETVGAGVFELLSGLVAAEEGARGQLAAELHDTVAQSLIVARNLLADHPLARTELAALADHLEDAEEQVRAVMARTRPPALREGDLAQAVGDLRRDVRARYGLEVEVVWPATPVPLPLATAITLYRFFQEALLNVVKHADVDLAVLELALEDGVVRAAVLDEGPGFDPGAVRPERGRHVGLGLLRERARLSGGSLEVVSGGTGEGIGGAAGGTRLELRLPRPADRRPVDGPPAPGDLLHAADPGPAPQLPVQGGSVQGGSVQGGPVPVGS